MADQFLLRVMAQREAEQLSSLSSLVSTSGPRRFGGRPKGSTQRLTAAAVLRVVQRMGEASPAEVARDQHAPLVSAQQLMFRMCRAGTIRRIALGRYILP